MEIINYKLLKFSLIVTIIFYEITFIKTDNEIKLLIVKEKDDMINVNFNGNWQSDILIYDRDDMDQSWNKACEILKNGVSFIMDFTWGDGWESLRTLDIPYIRADTVMHQLLHATDEFLINLRHARDAVLIFQHKFQLEQSLYYLVNESPLRVMLLNGLQENTTESIKQMRPTPSFYVIFGESSAINQIYKIVVEKELMQLNDKWHFVPTDFNYYSIERNLIKIRTGIITVNDTICCIISNDVEQCLCSPDTDLQNLYAEQLSSTLEEAVKSFLTNKGNLSPVQTECTVNAATNDTTDSHPFYSYVKEAVQLKRFLRYRESDKLIWPYIKVDFFSSYDNEDTHLAYWTPAKGVAVTSTNLPNVKRFFRIGTGYSIPFAWPEKNENGTEIWVGYSIDLIDRLAKQMNFDYELVTEMEFGKRLPDGSWNGLIGLLANRKIDMIVAALTMTAEREEVVDFVPPYIEQTGLSILIRKPVRQVSLFKFMTVLKVEVWISIVAAILITAFMLWFLDKYSPYSGRNNKEAYSYTPRIFTVRESLWFALCSFTQEGGGSTPKSLSARTLVAAYWLFVVLMLATFTANLAAFLTVERMQSPVQSLEQLGKQSRINYTVITDSDAHLYFRNMRNAEEVLYQKWKEITLNASTDQSQYRVWDYPIKEQYSRLLLAIEKAGTVSTVEEAYAKIQESEKGEFALIHDALEVRYQVYRNCNFTEIGEPFGEQPYAIAVQQGSQLSEEISRRILDLQLDRYFEYLRAKYWNASVRGKCYDLDENEGITLESLGGVFIATIAGLILAMITLAGEVYYHKKKEKNQIHSLKVDQLRQQIHNEILTSKEFGHSYIQNKSLLLNSNVKNPSYLSVLPRGQLY